MKVCGKYTVVGMYIGETLALKWLLVVAYDALTS